MTATYLDGIVTAHRRRAAADDRDWPSRVRESRYEGPAASGALRRAPFVRIIAEVKRRSPSRGWLNEGLDAAATATRYVDGGAAMVSVLTDADSFAGSLDDLAAAARAVPVPVLRKDFTVCENDVLDARDAGAAAVLLIVAALTDDELVRFSDLARTVGLEALVEVHDEPEAHRALDAGATLVGVNQRDLHTFAVDPIRAARVAHSIPDTCVRVCESGLTGRADVEAAARAGFDAALIGEALVTAVDPAHALRDLVTVTATRP